MRPKSRVGQNEYRDDRLFVMNLYPSGGGRWELVTFRNTGLLPSVRTDEFANFQDAERYVKKVEVTVPLQSLSGKPMILDHLESNDQRYEFFLTWLQERGLFGTMRQYQHCPYWHDPRGWTEKKAAVRIRRRRLTCEDTEFEMTETSFPLREK